MAASHQTFATNKGDFSTNPALDPGQYEELNILITRSVAGPLPCSGPPPGWVADLNNHNYYEVYLANNVMTGVVDTAKLRESHMVLQRPALEEQGLKLSPFDDTLVSVSRPRRLQHQPTGSIDNYAK